MIEKTTIIITSVGRTRTQFFATLMGEIISDATSVHEPDYLNFGQYESIVNRAIQVIRQVQEVGFSNIIIGKALANWNLKAISDGRVRGNLSRSVAAKRIVEQREAFISKQPGSVFVESSSVLYGLIEVIPDAFARHRVVYLVRDGRSWIRSMINFSSVTMYSKGLLRRLISSDWPAALEIPGNPYQQEWSSMSVFEKLCWAWSTLNSYALTTLQEDPHPRLFHIEDIFRADNRYGSLEDLLIFALSCTDQRPPTISSLYWLDRKMYKSDSGILPWQG